MTYLRFLIIIKKYSSRMLQGQDSPSGIIDDLQIPAASPTRG